MKFWLTLLILSVILGPLGWWVFGWQVQHNRYHYGMRKTKPWYPHVPSRVEDLCMIVTLFSILFFCMSIIALIEGAPNPFTDGG